MKLFARFVTPGPWTELQKTQILDAIKAHALYILEYNHGQPDGCPGCLERILVRELNEIIDELWPTDQTRKAGISYDAETDEYTVHI